MSMWGRKIPSGEPGRQVQRPWSKMRLAYSRNTKKASVIPGQRVKSWRGKKKSLKG